jgi:DtxR family transcriptional regulator, Mn-dependent transcriptional regulator
MPSNEYVKSKVLDSHMEKSIQLIPKLSPAIEDYLKAIYLLADRCEAVTTSLVAEQLGFTPASVSTMLQKLAALGLVAHEPYHGVALTEHGRRQALEILRHHRLIELFLVQALGYAWDDVHAEAEVLEHAISHKLGDRIAAYLGHPTVDPHGDPIPGPDGTIIAIPTQPLVSLALGARGEIVQVTDQQPAHLRYFAELGLVPGAHVTLHAQAPFDGPLTVRIGTGTYHLDSQLARAILVRPMPAQDALAA